MNAIFDPSAERLDRINEQLSLIQFKRGLTFGTDSYLLAAFAKAQKNGVAIELGGGTGVVSLLTASRKKYKSIHCVEIQPYFADLIERNARLNQLDSVIHPLHADVRDLTPDAFGRECDVVFSNPPYMRPASGKENDAIEMNLARREENGTISDFCCAASRLLRYGGYFTVVYRPDRMAKLLCALRENGLEPKRIVTVYPTVESKPCLLLAEAKKGAGEGVLFSRPLIIYKDKTSGEYTDDMKKIYDEFTLEHLF